MFVPSLDFAAGLLGGFADTYAKERARKEKNALDVADFMIRTGRAKDMNDVLETLPQFQEMFGGQKGKGGKGSKGGDPRQELLAGLMNPAMQMGAQTAGGQQKPSFQQPQGGGSKLFTEDEMRARGMEDLKQKEQIQTEGAVQQTTATSRAQYEERNSEIGEFRAAHPDVPLRDVMEWVATGRVPTTTRLQQKQVMVDGKATLVNYDAATGKSYGDDGQEIVGAKPMPRASDVRRLTGADAQAVDQVLMERGLAPQLVEPSSPEYREAVQVAAKRLASKQNLDAEGRRILIRQRQWLMGDDLGGEAPPSPASSPGAGPQAAPKPTAVGVDPSATGEAVLKNLPPSEAAEVRQVAEYRKALPARYFNSPRGAKILGLVEQYTGKTFDQTMYNTRQRARIAFTSGKSGDNIRSLNQLTGHMAQAAEAATKLQNAPIQLWNRIANAGLEQTGDPRVDAFLAPARAVATEMQNLLRGGVGDRKSIDDWQKLLNQVKSPAQIQAVIGAMQSLAGSRLEALETQWKSAMGDAPFDFLTPESEKAMARIGVRVRQGSATGGARKITVTAPDGSVHSFDTQEQADAFKQLAGIK